MIKQAIFRDDTGNTLIVTKPYANYVMLCVNNKKITIKEDMLQEMITEADKPCPLFKEIKKERDQWGIEVMNAEEEKTPDFFRGRASE